MAEVEHIQIVSTPPLKQCKMCIAMNYTFRRRLTTYTKSKYYGNHGNCEN